RVPCDHSSLLSLAHNARLIFIELLCSVSAVLVIKRLNAITPCKQVQVVNFLRRNLRINHQVKRLALVDKLLADRRLVDNDILIDFTERLKSFTLRLRQEVEMLNASVMVSYIVPYFARILTVRR